MTFSTFSSPGVSLQGGSGSGGTPGGATTQIQYNNAGAFAGASGLTTNGTNLTFGSASQLLWSTDLILTRRAAANLRLGAADAAAPVAQTLSVQSVVAGTSNTAGANLTITGSQGTGTGAGGSIVFQVAPAGSSGTAQNALATALTINSSQQALVGDGSNTAPPFSFSGRTGMGFYRAGTQLVFADSSADIWWTGASAFIIRSNGAIGFSSGTGPGTSSDTVLWRDTANTLALRNGTNAQTFRSYRSFTDASNYSRLAMAWNTSTALVMAEGAGTGSDGSVAFNDAALATNATVGFVMIPSCAGAPTGTPADIPTGQIPMVWDSTNLKLYVYTGGAWKSSAAFT